MFSYSRLKEGLFYVLGGNTEMFGDIAVEVRDAIEVHFPCNFLCRELSMLQQMPNLHCGELLDPVAGRATAYPNGNFVQMFGSHI